MDPKTDIDLELPVSARILERLTESARRYVLTHPKAAELAIRGAIEGAAASAQVEDVPSRPEPAAIAEAIGRSPPISPRERLRARVIAPSKEDLLNVTEAAKALEINRKTVYDWIGKRRLLAWRTSKHGYTIPREQIIGPERIVEGIADLLEIIPNAELAWAYLSQPWPFKDTVARPIDKLRAGELKDVLGAASSFGSSPA